MLMSKAIIPKMILTQGECLAEMAEIPDNYVDMVLCDLPYGTTACKWDTVIDFEAMWVMYKRICKPTAAIVLTATQPFTSVLVCSNLKDFKYQWVWRKTKPGGFFNAKNRPLRIHEDVLVFSRGAAANVNSAKMIYYPQGVSSCNVFVTDADRNKRQDSTVGPRPSRGKGFIQTQTGYPVDIIEVTSDTNHLHPTQKPVALMEYMIKTYTDEGMMVLDNCMGSGTTGVAAVNLGRAFVGIERDPAYFKIASERIAAAQKAVRQ
jgi:site-specific DNA-methyltransferase (adenine-specific)